MLWHTILGFQIGLPFPGPGNPSSGGGGGGATWTLVNYLTASTSSTCVPACPTTNLGFTGAIGDVLLVWSFNGSNRFVSAGDTGYGTWVLPGASTLCTAFQASSGSVSCAYVILTSTTTAITMTMNNSGGVTWFNVRQFHKSTGTITAETVPAGTTNISCGASGTKCTAPTVTIGAGNDVVASGISVINTACATTSPFTNFAQDSNEDGMADNLMLL